MPNNDSPGLAMARAFGDFCLKDFGLISVPEISYRRLTEKDEFVVLATDGVGDILEFQLFMGGLTLISISSLLIVFISNFVDLGCTLKQRSC